MAVDAAADTTAAATGGAPDGAAVSKRESLKQRARARGYTKYSIWGFDSPKEYFASLKTTPQLAAARAFYVKDPADALADRQGNELKRTLNWFSVAALGTGMIVGSGIFVSTGVAAKEFSGPAIILSMAIAGFCALLSCLIYAEFSSGWPVAGGSYTFVALTMGELCAFLVVTTLVFEYVLANAAVARTFSAYFAQLISPKDGPTVVLTIEWGSLSVDFVALACVFAMAALLMVSTRAADILNTVCTGAQMCVILVLIVSGFIKANPANMVPFAPNGVRGIFNGASFVFFSFIGFDAVATLSEETKKPERDMPVGVVGCISFVTVVYIIMSLVLVMMVPYSSLDESAAFAVAFEQAGFLWGRYLVAVGAVLGTITGVMVGLMGVARLICCLCRSHIGLPLFGRVNAARGTPMWGTALTAVFTAPFALLTDLPALIDMCSAAALAAFGVVAVAHLFKRWMPRKATSASAARAMGSEILGGGDKAAAAVDGADDKASPAKWADGEGGALGAAALAASDSRQGKRAACVIAAVVALSVGFAIAWGLSENSDGLGWISIVVLAAAVYAVTIYGACTLKKLDTCVFEAPLFPFLPVTSLLMNCFLMASLSGKAYWQLAIFWVIMVAVYLLYSVHAATVFDALQQRGCAAATTAAGTVSGTAAASRQISRLGSVVRSRESATVRGRAGAGVSILPPDYDFVPLEEDVLAEQGAADAAAAAKATPKI